MGDAGRRCESKANIPLSLCIVSQIVPYLSCTLGHRTPLDHTRHAGMLQWLELNINAGTAMHGNLHACMHVRMAHPSTWWLADPGTKTGASALRPGRRLGRERVACPFLTGCPLPAPPVTAEELGCDEWRPDTSFFGLRIATLSTRPSCLPKTRQGTAAQARLVAAAKACFDGIRRASAAGWPRRTGLCSWACPWGGRGRQAGLLRGRRGRGRRRGLGCGWAPAGGAPVDHPGPRRRRQLAPVRTPGPPHLPSHPYPHPYPPPSPPYQPGCLTLRAWNRRLTHSSSSSAPRGWNTPERMPPVRPHVGGN